MNPLDLIFDAISKRINKTFVYDKNYLIGECQIVIPSSLNLPRNQRKYPLYDRFLPVLSSHLTSGTVIDVGANVGDTLFAMLQNCSNSFVCIEASEFFFKYLEKNVAKIIPSDTRQIRLVKELVGSGNFLGTLEHSEGSTATIKVQTQSGNISSQHTPLDKIVSEHSNVVLIKSDVDGYDFDVIRSSEKILTQSEPVLFWENEISDDFQYEGYTTLYDFLEEKGYYYIYVFDNFGNLLVENSDYKTMKNINAYLYNIEKQYATRTFFYTDIIASTEKRKSIVEKAIEDYKSNCIRKTVKN